MDNHTQELWEENGEKGPENVMAMPEDHWTRPDFLHSTQDKLQFLAEENGLEVEDFLDTLVDLLISRRQQRALQEAGGDKTDARMSWEAYCANKREDWQKRTQQAREKRQEAMVQRLAEEFVTLSQAVPEIVTPQQIPQEVLQAASNEGISLLDAYLRFAYREYRLVEEAKKQEQAAAGHSAGSLHSGVGIYQPERTAFAKAFKSALG